MVGQPGETGTNAKGSQMPVIFVFGSNLAGRHGAGAALFAFQNHGAIYGQGRGLQGKSYAIPTKDEKLQTRKLEDIAKDVDEFIKFAQSYPELKFNVTPIGTGLAGLSHEEMAPLFKNVPDNCILCSLWKDIIFDLKNEELPI